jgi:uncharacterized protein
MKYLLVVAVVWIAFPLWRNNRIAEQRKANPPDAPKNALGKPQDMVRCPVCDLHLPRSDAVTGHRGAYCGDAHRKQAEP